MDLVLRVERPDGSTFSQEVSLLYLDKSFFYYDRYNNLHFNCKEFAEYFFGEGYLICEVRRLN